MGDRHDDPMTDPGPDTSNEVAAVADALIRARHELVEVTRRLRAIGDRSPRSDHLARAADDAVEAVVRLEAELVEAELVEADLVKRGPDQPGDEVRSARPAR